MTSYRQHVDQHLVPSLGRVRLAKLGPQHVRQLHTDLRGKGLSPATVGRVHATLRKALSDAAADELVVRNVAKIVPPPTASRSEARPLTLAQARALLDEVRNTRHEAAYVLMLTVGLRLGEVLGLRWSDVDLEAGELRVRRQLRRVDGALVFSDPKSSRSRRSVSLPGRRWTRWRGIGAGRPWPLSTVWCSPRRWGRPSSRGTFSATGRVCGSGSGCRP